MPVFTIKKLTNELKEAAASFFGINADDLNFLDYFENYVFDYVKSGKEYILRITDSRHRSKNQVIGEIEWLNFLVEKGTDVYRPVLSSNNEYVEEINSNESKFFVVSFEKAIGSPKSPEKYSEKQLELWGETIGLFHKLTTDFLPSNQKFKRIAWYEDDLVSKKYLPKKNLKIRRSFDKLYSHIKQLPINTDIYGLIHSDIHIGNIIWKNDNEFKVIDFDDSCYKHFISDLAIALFYGTMHLDGKRIEKNEFANYLFSKLIKGYRRNFYIERNWLKEELPNFLKLRDFTLYSVVRKKISPDDRSAFIDNFMKTMEERVHKDWPVVELNYDKIL